MCLLVLSFLEHFVLHIAQINCPSSETLMKSSSCPGTCWGLFNFVNWIDESWYCVLWFYDFARIFWKWKTGRIDHKDRKMFPENALPRHGYTHVFYRCVRSNDTRHKHIFLLLNLSQHIGEGQMGLWCCLPINNKSHNNNQKFPASKWQHHQNDQIWRRHSHESTNTRFCIL